MTAIALKPQKKRSDPTQQSMDRALKYLSYRPRSEAEMKIKLKRYGYNSAVITKTVNRLKSTGLIDDSSFATRWKENRQNNSPRSALMLQQELKQKGITSEIIAAVISDIDNETEAYNAASKKAISSRVTDIYQFRKKISVFLRHRGFGYEVVKTVTEKLWQDNSEEELNE